MRVALFSTSVPFYCGCLANELANLCELSLLMPQDSIAELRSLLNPRIALCPFHQPPAKSPVSAGMGFQVYQQIRALKPDVLHLQGGNIWLTPFLPLLAAIPIVTTIHDPWLHEGEHKVVDWLTALLTRSASDHLIVHGQTLREYLVRRLKYKASSVTSIPLGEFSIYQKLSPACQMEEVDGQFLFFGRIRRYKGVEVLLAAQPEISALFPQARFVIAGSGNYFSQHCLSLIRDPSRFKIYNHYIPNHQVAELFQQASIVVLPYTDATQSAVIPLAYAFAKPVVATRVGAIPEVVKDGVTGLLVPPGDPHALAEAALVLLKDPARRRSMGKRAYEKAMTDLSWKRIAQMTMNVYQGMLGISIEECN